MIAAVESQVTEMKTFPRKGGEHLVKQKAWLYDFYVKYRPTCALEH